MILTTKLKVLTAAMLLLIAAQAIHANPSDFTLRSVTSTDVFRLSEAKGKFVALHLLLKTECPYCLRHTHDYAQKSEGDSRVVHVFVKPDTEAEIRAWAARLGEGSLKITIYRDPDAAPAKEFHIPGGYKFHGQTVNFPALVLLDTSGKEVFRYVGKSNADRMSYEQLSAKLEELTKPSQR